MDRGLLLAGAVAVAAIVLLRRQGAAEMAVPDPASGDGGSAWYDSWLASGTPAADETQEWAAPEVDAMGNVTGIGYQDSTMSTWNPTAIPAQYAAAIRAAEQDNGMPVNLLARLLYQESHFRPDIISGNTKSAVGAIGIAQFMPATARALGVNPLDPIASIAAAGQMLRDLYDATGSWALALVSYNWGIGNLRKKGLARAPLETQQYYKQILSDIGLSPTVA